jgi:alcohol dehydrogenase
MLTHTFSLNQIKDAYDLFGNRSEGVIKVAIRP